jgi:hypothetical protein
MKALPEHFNLLTRRPAKLTSSKNMNVQMINRLTAIWAIIHNHTESISETQILNELPGNNQEMSYQLKMNSHSVKEYGL